MSVDSVDKFPSQFQINNFVGDDDLPKPKSLSELSEREIRSICGDNLVLLGERLSELSAKQISYLTASQIECLSPGQLAILKPEQVSCLSRTQILAIRGNQRAILKPGDPLELRITKVRSQSYIKNLRKANSYICKKLGLFFVERFCDTNNLKKIESDIKLCNAVSILISSLTVLPLIHDLGVYVYKKTCGTT